MIQRPRGTRDFGPEEMAVRRWAAAQMDQVFDQFGYKEVQTPVFENLELFTAKSGEGILSELYHFRDKGERDIALRPELTAPVMRMYFGEHQFDPKPIKWRYLQSCYRYDRPQKGRYREFYQYGCEQIGAGTPLAYAELITLASKLFASIGLQGVELFVGQVKILAAVVNLFGLADDDRAQLMRLIDKRDDDTISSYLAQKGADACDVKKLFAVMDARDLDLARLHLEGLGVEEEVDALDECLAFLESFGTPVTLNLGIARGLDYYTGIVFEGHCPDLGAEKQVLGGGGYDLSAVFEAQSTPTMGFGLGFDRVLVALEAQDVELPKGSTPLVTLGALSDAAKHKAVEFAVALRDAGKLVDLDIAGRKPGPLAKSADSQGSRFLLLLGDRDLESGQVRIKDMASGDQHDVALVDVVSWLQSA